MTTYYKVLVNGQSCNGGTLKYSLPNGKPGRWHSVKGDLIACQKGLHLTDGDHVGAWWLPGAEVYEAEFDGEHLDGGDKIVCRKVRLLRQLSDDDLAALRIYRMGAHVVRDGTAWASGFATVEAFDSATVRASGSATVRASGSATVETRKGFGMAKPTITIDKQAIWIDRYENPQVHLAWAQDHD